MSWSDRILPWLSDHVISLFVVGCLVVLAVMLYSRAYYRRANIIGASRRLDQLQRPRSQPPTSEAEGE